MHGFGTIAGHLVKGLEYGILIYFIQLLSGRLSQESYNKWFQVYLSELIKSNRYDRVIVESGPTNLVRLVSKVCTCHKITLFDWFQRYLLSWYV